METVLLILGVLGLGAIVISVYIFTVAARNYVSEERPSGSLDFENGDKKSLRERSRSDRRQTSKLIDFPIVVNGVRVYEDRRQRQDRRVA